MKIAMVADHADPFADGKDPSWGAQHVHVGELSAALVRRGHDVVVYTRRDGPDCPDDRTAEAGFRVVCIPAGPSTPLSDAERYQHLCEFTDGLSTAVCADPPDIVHAHFWMSALASELATVPLRLPTVVTYHSLGSVESRFDGRGDDPSRRITIERVTARHANAVIATCADEVAQLHEAGVSTHRMHVIPSGVDAAGFGSPGDVRVEPARRQRHRLVSMGRLLPRNGFETVITALTDVPDTELIVAGRPTAGGLQDDPEARRLKACAAQVGVGDRVRFVGTLPRSLVPGLLHSADIVVSTPWYESFGLVPLEAMAAGVPVVASAVGGMLDTVVPGITGELVPPRDPVVLASTLRSLLSSVEQRQCYGRAARRRAELHYRWATVADKTLALYRRLLLTAREDRGDEAAVSALRSV